MAGPLVALPFAVNTIRTLLPYILAAVETANTAGKLSKNNKKYNMARMAATFNQLLPTAGSGAGAGGNTGDTGTSADPDADPDADPNQANANSFKNYFYPTSDILGLGFGMGGKLVGAGFKSAAANQLARGNAAQHIAAAMSNPSSEAVFGNPLGNLAKISADAGQAKASGTLAWGDATQGSAEDVSNFINSINTMRRLMSGNALSAMGLWGMGRIINRGK